MPDILSESDPKTLSSLHLMNLDCMVDNEDISPLAIEQIVQGVDRPNLTSPRHACNEEPKTKELRDAVARWLSEQDIDTVRCVWTGVLIPTRYDGHVMLHDEDIVTNDAFEQHGGVCDDCEDNFASSDLTELGWDHQVCGSCLGDNWRTCRRCDEYVHRHDRCECSSDDELQDCGDSPLDDLKGFLSAPGEKLPEKPLWLGVELEVVPKTRDLEDGLGPAMETLSHIAIFKEDGSLPDSGFEICTVPGTLAWHRGAWNDFFKHAARHLLSYNAPYNSCGMHVHLDKDALSPLQAGKMMVFVADERNRGFLRTIAGRGNTQYVRAFPKKLKDGRHDRGSRYGHFDALGYSGHTGRTLEFRIFRGTVNKQGFFKNLEFTVALVEFCKETSASNLLVDDFLRWFVQPGNRTRFPELDALLHRKGLISIKKPRPEGAALAAIATAPRAEIAALQTA